MNEKFQDKLIVRIQLIGRGPAEALLGLAIAWVSRFRLNIDTELEIVGVEGGFGDNVGYYQGVLLRLGSGAPFPGSGIHQELKLKEIAALTLGPLNDFLVGSESDERHEFMIDFSELTKLSLAFELNRNRDNPLANQEFREASAKFQKKYLAEVDKRLRTHFGL